MKLSKLYLKAYGPYTERVIDFDATAASLHIVYGPNEAGKSSLLRAIRAFLYGIPERTQDNFLHENAALRLGGLITDGAERQLAAVRRKARKLSLRQWNGKIGTDCEGEALTDNAILNFLGGLEETQFTMLFGIDRQELVRGGQVILEGKGDIGESLFEAGAGLTGLRRLRDVLEVEAGALFAPRANKPLINATLGEYDDARRTAKEAAVRTDEWTRRDEVYATAVQTLNANRKTIDEKRLERERLTRIRSNLPMIARREECLGELSGLTRIPDLAVDFAERRVGAVTAKANAERSRNEAHKRVSELEEELKEIKVPIGYIERGALIQGVYSGLSAYQQVQLEIPGLEARQRGLIEEAHIRLRELGMADDLVSAEKFRPKKGDQARVRELIKEHSDLSGQIKELRRREVDLQADLEMAELALSSRANPPNPAQLEDSVLAISVHPDSEQRYLTLIQDLALRKQELDHKTHGLGNRTTIELRELRPPAKATLQRLQQETDIISRERDIVSSQVAQRRLDFAALQAKKTTLELAGPVPSEDELAKARVHREQGWQLVRQGYIERTADPEKLVKEYVPNKGLPDAYENAVVRADTIADGLRLDTQRMTEHALALERIGQLAVAIRGDEAKLQELDKRAEAWQKEWAEIIESVGVTIATVRELDEWLVEREGIVASFREFERRQQEADELNCAIVEARGRLLATMIQYSQSIPEGETLTVLLAKAHRLLESVRRDVTEFEAAKNAVEGLQSELSGQQKRIQGLDADFVKWRNRWGTAVTTVGAGENTEPVEAEARLTVLDELFNAIDGASRIGQELSEKQAAAHRYSEEVKSLGVVLDVNGQGKSIGDVVATLFSQHQDAVKINHHYEQAFKQVETERLVLKNAEGEVDGKEEELANLCRSAGVTDILEFPAIEEKARRKGILQTEVDQIERQLTERNSSPLDRLLEEASAIDRDTLAVEILGIEDETKAFETSQIALAQQARDAELALKEIDGSSKAAEAAQQAQELLARLRTATEDYVRIKASSFVIARAIDGYRQRHQGPILKRASEYFSTLTRGSFKGLDVDFKEDDRQVLVGVRGNGKQVLVDGMSDGARDQLYLALRLAAIERHLEAGPSIPIIVDDILVQFDDIRATAAFEAFGMLAARTQVLLLTHHEHLLSLAEQTVKKSVLAIHRLEIPVTT